MNNRRTIGNALATLGSPASLTWAYILSTVDDPDLSWLWAVPLAIATLPLLPLAFRGESILSACDREDFHQKTKHLPHVYLPYGTHPQAWAYIENGEHQDFLVQPFYYQDEAEPFDNLAEARQFLQEHGYEEVVALDHPDALDTYWVIKS
jgi:hypothetical protein